MQSNYKDGAYRKVGSIVAEFTQDWFTRNTNLWTEVLSPLKDKPIKAVELGSYEGQSAVWLAQNVLVHPKSTLDCVDNWNGGGELEDHDWPAIYKRFLNNTKPFKQIKHHKTTTTDYLKKRSEPADLIYIDAGHFANSCLIDAVLSHLILKPGGILIFDDYLIGGLLHTPLTPKTAIDAFTECFAQEYEWLVYGYQVILRKLHEKV